MLTKKYVFPLSGLELFCYVIASKRVPKGCDQIYSCTSRDYVSFIVQRKTNDR